MTSQLLSAPPSAAAKFVRKSTSQRIEATRLRKAQLEAKLASLEARQKTEDRKRDTRRKVIVGAVVLTHAEHDPAFRTALQAALRAGTLRDIDRAVIADLLD